MSSVSRKQESANSERLGASLVQLIRTGTHEFIISWFRVSGEDLLKPRRLTREILFVGQAPDVTVCHSP